jgi:hypothetical protein
MRLIPTLCNLAVLPSRDECYEAGKQTITSEFGYVTSFWPRQQASVSSSSSLSSGAAVAGAQGYTFLSSTTSETVAMYDDFTPCPMEFRLLPGQRLNFTLYDFGTKNHTNVLYGGPSGGGGSDYYDEGSSKVCHR